jgi:antitoxin MazE
MRGTMLVKAQKWGNSLAVRLPKALAKECGIEADTLIEIVKQDDGIVLKPVPKRLTLDALLSGITAENLHTGIGTGKPLGREIW